jgi:hypothetical protein
MTSLVDVLRDNGTEITPSKLAHSLKTKKLATRLIPNPKDKNKNPYNVVACIYCTEIDKEYTEEDTKTIPGVFYGRQELLTKHLLNCTPFKVHIDNAEITKVIVDDSYIPVLQHQIIPPKPKTIQKTLDNYNGTRFILPKRFKEELMNRLGRAMIMTNMPDRQLDDPHWIFAFSGLNSAYEKDPFTAHQFRDMCESVSASSSGTEEINPAELLSQLTPLNRSNQEPQGVARKRKKNQRLNDFVT